MKKRILELAYQKQAIAGLLLLSELRMELTLDDGSHPLLGEDCFRSPVVAVVVVTPVAVFDGRMVLLVCHYTCVSCEMMTFFNL